MNIFPQRIPKGDVPPPQILEAEVDATAEWFAMNVKSVYVLGVRCVYTCFVAGVSDYRT